MDYLLDVHTHTIASGHAYNSMMEMAKAGFDKGLKLLGITCLLYTSPSPRDTR